MILSDSSKEIAQGRRFSKLILSRSKLSQNRDLVYKINQIGRRVAKITDKEYGTKKYDWNFYLIDNDNKINAFCLSGGYVFIYSGLLKYIKSEDELAVVMGHEIAHSLARHIAEKRTTSKISNIIKGFFDFLITIDTNAIPMQRRLDHKIVKRDIENYIILPHSRKQEYEADHIGLILSSKAGYNPKSALAFWNRFQTVSKKKLEYKSTHPTPRHRIEEIKKLMPTLLDIYDKLYKSAP
jgi:predicted Zn-dependent protease